MLPRNFIPDQTWVPTSSKYESPQFLNKITQEICYRAGIWIYSLLYVQNVSSLHIFLYPIEARKKKDGKYVNKIYTDLELLLKKIQTKQKYNCHLLVLNISVLSRWLQHKKLITLFISKLKGIWVAITIIIIFTSPRNFNKLLESSWLYSIIENGYL